MVKSRKKYEKLKVSSTGKSLKNAKNSKSLVPVLREMLRKKTLKEILSKTLLGK